MTTCELAGGASTNSRGKRPLPPHMTWAKTLFVTGVTEIVEMHEIGGMRWHSLISWVGGQSGLLWGGGPYPFDVLGVVMDVHGAYGHSAEYELAEALGDALGPAFGDVPLACRFFQDGGTALAAAARLARYATGRYGTASYGYHGAAAEWAHKPNTKGILEADYLWHDRFEWGDVERMRYLAEFCAAICVEVPAIDDEQAIAAFLHECRKACDEFGSVFILDEVVTGFRLALGGAAECYGVRPDIACYGKAISATGCVSAVVGRRELVAPIGGDVFYSTTFGGAPGPCGVAAATVRWLTEHPEAFAHITHIGELLKEGLNERGVRCVGQPERSILVFDTDAEWLAFCSAMIAEGVVVHRPQFPTLAHTEQHVHQTLQAVERVLEKA